MDGPSSSAASASCSGSPASRASRPRKGVRLRLRRRPVPTLASRGGDGDGGGNGGGGVRDDLALPLGMSFAAVLAQDGNEVFFRIKRSTQLKKLMNAYCDRQSVDMNAIAFLFDGRRLRGEQTPDELEMEDGDEIDAMLHQTGGCLLPIA